MILEKKRKTGGNRNTLLNLLNHSKADDEQTRHNQWKEEALHNRNA